MKFSSVFLVVLFVLNSVAFTQVPKTRLSEMSAEQAGFNADSLKKLEHYLESSGSSALLLVYDGQVFFDWGKTDRKHVIHSIRKALLSSLYGIFVEKGVIDTSATLADLGIDDIEPSLTPMEKQATVADLLKSRSGVYHNAAAVSRGMLAGKPERGSFKPNEHFYYNNWDFNTLGYILEMKTGESIFDLFYEEIALPLGMLHYQGKFAELDGEDEKAKLPDTDGVYQYEKSKSKYPAYHFRMSAHDLAKYGVLYMNEGRWNGKQIVPESWVEASTTSYSLTNRYVNIGYGMLWSVLIPNEQRKTKSFYHTGAGAHMLGVYPGSKLVMVHRVDTEGENEFKQERLYEIISLIFASQN
ncbi:MAG: serine hydrolase [Gracilimonas sp.]|uniref:serine hydrolase domain-containing protein n=1 Tax=Gracilimonas sp. TaxID=1974203 RepID=UPI001B14590C|nr:serine hydrolase [Gracilimonas sp.]MBO6584866.1 serine hydrolase [Gracilimonas sp.]MBO6615863.1 serine hydrolase [Gracilimonas sp.]